MSTSLTSVDGRPLDREELENKGTQLTERIIELIEEIFDLQLGDPDDNYSDIHVYINETVKEVIEEVYDTFLDKEEIIKE